MAKSGRRSVQQLLLFVSVILRSATAVTEQVWSPWYNSSPGQVSSEEDETLDRIEQTHQLPCARSSMAAVQCRVAGGSDNVTFSGEFRHADNVLHVPCNLTGLLCLHHDQILAGTAPCRDYELRVLCLLEGADDHPQHTGDSNTDKNDYSNVGVKGGFTAMAAGGAVVIPLTCVLVYQLRRYKREDRQRQQQLQQQQARQSSDNARDEAAAMTADAPPAYDELFGHQDPISIITSGDLLPNGTGRTSLQADRGGGISERLLTSHAERLEGRINHGASWDLPAESAARLTSVVTSQPLFAAGEASPTAVAASSTTSSGGSSPAVGATRSPSTSSYSTSVSSLSSDRPASSLLSASTRSSSDALVPPSDTGSDDTTRRGPPPAYDWPGGPAHVTILVPGGDVGSRRPSRVQPLGPSSTPPPPPSSAARGMGPARQSTSSGGRRFLGMHLSIFDLISAIYPEDPLSTPPPSYDDALKILEASQPQRQVRIT